MTDPAGDPVGTAYLDKFSIPAGFPDGARLRGFLTGLGDSVGTAYLNKFSIPAGSSDGARLRGFLTGLGDSVEKPCDYGVPP